MKQTLSIALFTVLGGCSFAARSPQMFQDDTQKLFASKQGEMRACYDNVLKGDAKAAGSVKVNFTWEKDTGKLVSPAVDPASSAPKPVQDCVMNSLTNLTLAPGDARVGQGSWTFDFKPGA